ncbi:DNA photolyase [Tanacetum coccineum]
MGREGPTVLQFFLYMVFGAFLEHCRGNINDLVEGGNRVWAITLLGFGRSEKPNVVYTELMWAELLRFHSLIYAIELVYHVIHFILLGNYRIFKGGKWKSLVGLGNESELVQHLTPLWGIRPQGDRGSGGGGDGNRGRGRGRGRGGERGEKVSTEDIDADL